MGNKSKASVKGYLKDYYHLRKLNEKDGMDSELYPRYYDQIPFDVNPRKIDIICLIDALKEEQGLRRLINLDRIFSAEADMREYTFGVKNHNENDI